MYTDAVDPVAVPKNPSRRVPIPWNHQNWLCKSNFVELHAHTDGNLKNHIVTSQPTPRLRTEGGIGVALPNLDAAMNVPVDCSPGNKKDIIHIKVHPIKKRNPILSKEKKWR